MIRLTEVSLTSQQIDLVTHTLKSGHIVQGAITQELEQKWADYVGSSHAVAVNNGTAALHTALHAIGIKPGDQVITSPFTFVATANAIIMAGGRPVFADIDEHTFNISSTTIAPLITAKTKAILVVDLYGQPADYDSLSQLCRQHNLKLVSDACQAIGAIYKRQKLGSIADITTFSLYASKNVYSGEGGIITTNSQELADRCRSFRNHGQSPGKSYTYDELGYNYRLTDVLASIAVPQLDYIDQITTQRNHHAEYLNDQLKSVRGLILPTLPVDGRHAFHQYTVRVTTAFPISRDELQDTLRKQDIESRIYYPQLLSSVPHLQPYVQDQLFPIANRVVGEVLSLPIHQGLSTKELDTIVAAIKSVSS